MTTPPPDLVVSAALVGGQHFVRLQSARGVTLVGPYPDEVAAQQAIGPTLERMREEALRAYGLRINPRM